MRFFILVLVMVAGGWRVLVQEPLPASAYLSTLPDGEAKRQFIIDCMGCHTFHKAIAYPGGSARTAESWQERATSMISRFGPSSGFPVISDKQEAAALATWLHASLPPSEKVSWSWPRALEGRAEIREYMLPEPGDLPHDVALSGGEAIVTGMFTARMYILDPETGAVRTEPTPEPNPRAIEVDAAGNWWVVLGGPRKVARRAPGGEWKTFDAGFYAHSVALAPDGGVWVNGHFTHEPEILRRIDPVTGAARTFEVPRHPQFRNTTVPYELRAARDGTIWMSELQGNRLVRIATDGSVKTWDMPTTASGPRRLDVDPNGIVWIPEFGANKLARFDPKSETFTEYTLPLRDTAPYIARYDAGRNLVWIGTGAADALFAFDPRTAQFKYYRLPTPDALVRHLVISANGDIWLAPGSSPGTTGARVVRVRPI